MWAGWVCGRLRGAGGGGPNEGPCRKRGWLSPPQKNIKKRPWVHVGEAPWTRPRAPTGPGRAKSNNRWLHLPRGEILRTVVPPSPCPGEGEVSCTWWFRPDRREQKAPKPQTPPCGTPAPCSPTDWLTAAAGVASHFCGELSRFSGLDAVVGLVRDGISHVDKPKAGLVGHHRRVETLFPCC